MIMKSINYLGRNGTLIKEWIYNPILSLIGILLQDYLWKDVSLLC